MRRADARRYPYVRAKGGVPTPTTAVCYGKDGRRRLFGGVDAVGNPGGDQAEMGGNIDPRERALASSDVLFAVFSFVDRYVRISDLSFAASATIPPSVVVVDFFTRMSFYIEQAVILRQVGRQIVFRYSTVQHIVVVQSPGSVSFKVEIVDMILYDSRALYSIGLESRALDHTRKPIASNHV